MKIVTVIPLSRGVPKEELTYFTAQEISLGDVVGIKVRNKKILGLASFVEDAADTKSNIKNLRFDLRKIDEIKEQSIFRSEYLESAFRTSRYHACRKNVGIASLIPAVLKENYDQLASLTIKDKNLTPRPLRISEREQGGVKIKSEKLLFQASLDDRISYYKTLIRESFAKKQSVFLVLPTERDIAVFSELLRKGIENFSIAIHGGQSPKKQFENVKKIIENPHPVLIISTAIFLSLPRGDIKTIIVEHESSGAYRMIASPHFDLKIFSEIYASETDTKLILADTLLSFETIGRHELDNFGEVRPLSFKINFEGKIKIPMREGAFKVLGDNTITEIKNVISKGKNVFIFSLRKGLASLTICRDCGEEVSCENCKAPLVLYLSKDGKKRMFVCNRCKKEASAETKCKNCGSWNLMPLGIGVDTVLETVKKTFPDTKILKLDKETARTGKEAEKIIKEYEESSGSILVGTEIALFYLTKKLPLSIIASFDSLWSIPNYKMSEKIIQIIVSILAKTEKKLIIETKNSTDAAIVAILNENLLSFVREELKDRKDLGYPPYERFIKIAYLGDKEETLKAKRIISEMFEEYNPVIFSGFVARHRGKYATNTLIKLQREKWSLPELSAGASIDENLSAKLFSLPPVFSVSVDPEDLL